MTSFKKIVATALLAMGLASIGASVASAVTNLVIHSATVPSSVANGDFQHAVAYGNGHWVSIAEDGTSLKSSDGKTWGSGGLTGLTVSYDVTYGNGRFVAVGDTKVSVSTDNGETWQISLPQNAFSWGSVAYGNGHFIALDYDDCGGRSIVSTDGITWTEVDTNLGYKCWTDIAYGNGTFVAISTDSVVAVSVDDGLTWNRVADADEFNFQPRTVAYGNGRFMILGDDEQGNVLAGTSTNGNLWDVHNFTSGALTTGLFREVAFGDGKWIAAAASPLGTNSIIVSTDNGLTWQVVEAATAGYLYTDAEFGNGTFVLSGQFTGSTPLVGRNQHGLSWLQTSAGSLANTGSNSNVLWLLALVGFAAVGVGVQLKRFTS